MKIRYRKIPLSVKANILLDDIAELTRSEKILLGFYAIALVTIFMSVVMVTNSTIDLINFIYTYVVPIYLEVT